MAPSSVGISTSGDRDGRMFARPVPPYRRVMAYGTEPRVCEHCGKERTQWSKADPTMCNWCYTREHGTRKERQVSPGAVLTETEKALSRCQWSHDSLEPCPCCGWPVSFVEG